MGRGRRVAISRLMTMMAVLLLLAEPVENGLAQELDPEAIGIGTGSHDGVYFPAGNAICRLLLRGFTEHGLRCQVLSTDGSLANLASLREGELDAAIVQSDWQHHAYRGSPPFEADPPFESLRTLFALHDEPFTVLARTDSGIQTLEDLQGKRVNIGNPGSGQRATMEVLMEALGWGLENFARVSELPAGEQAQALCDDEVDAIVFTVGHPNASILEATALCEVRLIPVTGSGVEAMVASHPYYFEAQIPGGLYRGNPDPVASFGVRGVFSTTAAFPEEEAYKLVKAVFEEFDGLRYAHPALGQLTPEAMVRTELAVPPHPGAVKYYRERRLLPDNASTDPAERRGEPDDRPGDRDSTPG